MAHPSAQHVSLNTCIQVRLINILVTVITFRESYLELMDLINEINPLVKFIHHCEKNAQDSDDEETQQEAAMKAYKETFGKECEWFDEVCEEQWETDADTNDTESESADDSQTQPVCLNDNN